MKSYPFPTYLAPVWWRHGQSSKCVHSNGKKVLPSARTSTDLHIGESELRLKQDRGLSESRSWSKWDQDNNLSLALTLILDQFIPSIWAQSHIGFTSSFVLWSLHSIHALLSISTTLTGLNLHSSRLDVLNAHRLSSLSTNIDTYTSIKIILWR